MTTSLLQAVNESGTDFETLEIDVLQLMAWLKFGFIGNSQVPMPAYIGREASANLLTAQAAVFGFTVGLSLSTGIGSKDGSLEVQVFGCGVTIGKCNHITALGNGVATDFGKLARGNKGRV